MIIQSNRALFSRRVTVLVLGGHDIDSWGSTNHQPSKFPCEVETLSPHFVFDVHYVFLFQISVARTFPLVLSLFMVTYTRIHKGW